MALHPEQTDEIRDLANDLDNDGKDPTAPLRLLEILAEDGRTFLRATGQTFDVIIGDLFVPWKAGTGSLYTREHFESARRRLKPGGILAQWIPLYQISREEFDIIARTMLEVFPLVTVWRGDFFEYKSILVLVGHEREESLEPEWVAQRLVDTPHPNLLVSARAVSSLLLSYCGNLTEARALVEQAPVNTDDRPLIEYRAPITHRRALAEGTGWFEREELILFYEELLETAPPERDLYLANLEEHLTGYVRAGFLVHRGRILRDLGKEEEAAAVEAELRELLDSIAGQ